jgi:hypothetical protein
MVAFPSGSRPRRAVAVVAVGGLGEGPAVGLAVGGAGSVAVAGAELGGDGIVAEPVFAHPFADGVPLGLAARGV